MRPIFMLLVSLTCLISVTTTAYAADALNGKKLYLNGPVSGGTSCANCHTASPSDNISNVLAGANNPNRIANAIAQNRGGMGALKNKFSTTELADIAAFLGNPNVTAAPAVSFAPANLSFNATTIGQSSTLSTTLTNTGSAALQLSTISLTSSEFKLSGGNCSSNSSLATGASCTFEISFQPSSSGTHNGNLSLSHNAAGGSSQIGLTGTANALPQASIAVSANSLNFGNIISNVQTPAQQITITNAGQAPLSFNTINITGNQASSFQLSGNCNTQTALAVGAQCTLSLQALLTQAGSANANLQILSNAANGNTLIALSANATAPTAVLAASVSHLAFGAISAGSASATQTFSLKNTGNVPITFTSVQASGSSQITIEASSTCKGTLEIDKLCNIQVKLTPGTVGEVNGQLTILSNAASNNITVSATVVSSVVAKPVLSDSATLQFTDTQVGTRSAKHISIFSNQGSAAFKINTLLLNGTHAADFLLGGSCSVNVSIAPGAQCSIESSFQATAAGVRTANLSISTDSGTQINLALQGTGIAVPTNTQLLSLSPSSFDFATQVIGASDVSQRIRLKNDGNVAIALIAPQIAGPYMIEKDTTSCPAFPFQLAAMSSCELIVQFHPTSVGTAAGSITLSNNDNLVKWTINLNGTGRAAAVSDKPVVTSNQGGGGCSVAQDGRDPMLPLLAIVAAVIVWRRRNLS
ncbi:MAG: choice-of-anchor D domain-containing protein [Burkholderiales bacterium]|nr:choice-of-anchor D domain-containing protein [Burkholderiales bacterium]